MVLKKLVESSVESSGERKPYLNDYLMDNPEEIGQATIVTKVVKRLKGWLICTDKYTAFIFNKTKIADYLTEALDSWYGRKAVSYPLYCIPDENGKPELAVDDEQKPSFWAKDGHEYSQSLGKKATSSSKKKTQNPLLPSPPVINGYIEESMTVLGEQYTEVEEKMLP